MQNETTNSPRGSRRPVLTHLTLNLLVAGYIFVALNLGFWSRAIEALSGDVVLIGCFAIGIFGLTVLALELLGPGRMQKPVAALLIMIAAGASYYERNFGVLIDRDMMRNIFETTVTESRHLITPAALWQMTLTGVIPAAMVFWPRVRRVRRWHHLWRWPVGVALSVALVLGSVAFNYKAYAAALRERRDVMASYQPVAFIRALVAYGEEQMMVVDSVLQEVAGDAAPGRHLAQAEKPVLMVLFVGETLRAQNFGLNGYERDTTPGLAARDVINFPDVTACGTSTSVSLPCMFSPLATSDYSREAALSRENLLDVLVRSGFEVNWVDNNTGDMGVAMRQGWQIVEKALAPDACVTECTDEVFLPLIEKTLEEVTEDTVLVLHMIGNHGPAYYLRYPEGQAPFSPDCRSAQFSDCPVQEIVNAYDNAVVETDLVLSRAIDMLDASDRVLPAMVFLSDHGESLGESGLYLHAAPRFMAPKEQTKVPMVMWLGDAFRDVMGLKPDCMRAHADAPVSHDHLFHTMLGLLDIRTAARDPSLDLTETCRSEDRES